MDNASLVRQFTLIGLNETMAFRVTIFSLTLVYYCVVLFVNISLIVIIILDSNLHEPMYILLCNLCINALYGTAGFYPKFLIDLQTASPEISYNGCLIQAFVMYSFACSDLSILAVMAYDRYLAICRPLHYHTIMTKKRLSQLVCFSWLTPWCVFALNVVLTSHLQLCGTHIQRVLCVNWVIVKLACPKAKTFPNSVTAYCTMVLYVGHGFFVVWTYMHMIKTCVRSKDDRVKFMQTCVPHLASMAIFLCTVLFDLMHMRFGIENIPQHLKNFIAIEFMLVTPFINPLIYGFKLTKIRNRIQGLFYVKNKLHLPAQTNQCS